MKKVIILLLALAMVLTLTACNNPPTTYASPRWKNETHLFTVRKAIMEDSTIIHNGETFIKEPGVTGYEPDVEKADEIVPEDIAGTYLMNISVDDANKLCTFTTRQVLYVAYPARLLEDSPIWNTPDENGNKLSDKVVPQNSEENPFGLDGSFITLKSITETQVVFHNDATQRPVSSKNSVDGFYIGKTAQTISKYELTTSYEWNDKNKVTITVNGETLSTSGTYADKFIDANQILLYVRSLDKTTTSFQDGPTVAVYMPKVDEIVTASFAYNYNCNTVVMVEGEEVYVNLTVVGVVVKNVALLIQLSVPSSVNADGKALDSIPNVGTDTDKYSTLRFRSGLYSYQLADFNSLENGSAILEAITTDLG